MSLAQESARKHSTVQGYEASVKYKCRWEIDAS